MLLVLEQLVIVPLQGADDVWGIEAARTFHRRLVLVENGIGRGGRGAGIGAVLGDEALYELLAPRVVVLVGNLPGPGGCTDDTLHGLGAGAVGHPQGEVGHHDLNGFLDAGGTREFDRVRHVLSKQYQHQHVGLELPGGVDGIPEIAVLGAGEGRHNALVDARIFGPGEVSDRFLGGVPPGVVGGNVEIAVLVARIVGLQIGRQRLGSHPRVVTLPEDVAVSLGPGSFGGIGERTEKGYALFFAYLARRNGYRAGKLLRTWMSVAIGLCQCNYSSYCYNNTCTLLDVLYAYAYRY